VETDPHGISDVCQLYVEDRFTGLAIYVMENAVLLGYSSNVPLDSSVVNIAYKNGQISRFSASKTFAGGEKVMGFDLDGDLFLDEMMVLDEGKRQSFKARKSPSECKFVKNLQWTKE
jgi:hypothetical protein